MNLKNEEIGDFLRDKPILSARISKDESHYLLIGRDQTREYELALDAVCKENAKKAEGIWSKINQNLDILDLY